MEVNKAAINNYGYTLGEFMHLSVSDLRAEKDPEALQQMLELINKETLHKICRHKKKNGDIILADSTSSIIEYKNRKAVLMIVKDITEKNRLQEELIREKLDKEKNRLEATLYGQELERVEIGKELHDNINQILSTVKLYLDMSVSDKKNSSDLIKKSTEFLMTAIQEIRGLSKTLVTSGVADLGLYGAINDLIGTISNSKSLNIGFKADEGLEELPPKIKLNLFRIIQEQLNNILRHAHAQNANITIVNDEQKIRLTIQDDGKGFDMSKKKNGIGLTNIISRTEIYKGTVIIDSAPGKGCLLEVSIPTDEFLKVAI